MRKSDPCRKQEYISYKIHEKLGSKKYNVKTNVIFYVATEITSHPHYLVEENERVKKLLDLVPLLHFLHALNLLKILADTEDAPIKEASTNA